MDAITRLPASPLAATDLPVAHALASETAVGSHRDDLPALIAEADRLMDAGHLAAGGGVLSRLRASMSRHQPGLDPGIHLQARVAEARLLSTLHRWADGQVACADVLPDLVAARGPHHPLEVRLRLDQLVLLQETADHAEITAAIAAARACVDGVPDPTGFLRLELEMQAAVALGTHRQGEDAIQRLADLHRTLPQGTDAAHLTRRDRVLALQLAGNEARFLMETKHYEEGIPLQLEVIAAAEELGAADPADLRLQRLIALFHSRILQWCTRQDATSAETELHRDAAQAIRQRLYAIDPVNDQWTRDWMTCWCRQAELADELDDHPECRRAYRQAVTLAEGLLARNPGNPRCQADVGLVLHHLAEEDREAGEAAAAFPHMIRSVELFEAGQLRNPLFQRDAENCLLAFRTAADLALSLQRNEVAHDLFRRCLTLAGTLAAQHAQRADFQLCHARAHACLAEFLARQGDRESALLHSRAALQISRRVQERHPEDVAAAIRCFEAEADLIDVMGDDPDHAVEAAGLLSDAFLRFAAEGPVAAGERYGFIVILRFYWAAAGQAERRQDVPAAVTHLSAGVEACRQWLVAHPNDQAIRHRTSNLCGKLIQLCREDELEQALTWSTEQLAILRGGPPDALDDWRRQQDLGNALDDRALVLRRLGRADEAETVQQDAESILEELVLERPEAAKPLVDLAICVSRGANAARERGDVTGAERRLVGLVKRLELVTTPELIVHRIEALYQLLRFHLWQKRDADIPAVRQQILSLIEQGDYGEDYRRLQAVLIGDLVEEQVGQVLDEIPPTMDRAVDILQSWCEDEPSADRNADLAVLGYRRRAYLALQHGLGDPTTVLADLRQAETHLRQAVHLGDDLIHRAEWAETLAEIAKAQWQAGAKDESLAGLNLAVSLLRICCADPDAPSSMAASLIARLCTLAKHHHAQGSAAAGLTCLQERTQVSQRMADACPADEADRMLCLLHACQWDLAEAQAEAGRFDEAVAVMAASVAGAQAALAAKSQSRIRQEDLAQTRIRLAEITSRAGNHALAATQAQEAQAAYQQLADTAPDPDAEAESIDGCVAAAEIEARSLVELQRPAEAEARLRTLLDRIEPRIEADLAGGPDCLWILVRLADRLSRQRTAAQDRQGALDACRRAQGYLRRLRTLTPRDAEVPATLIKLLGEAVGLQLDLQRPASARDDLEQAEALITCLDEMDTDQGPLDPAIRSRIATLWQRLEGR